MNKVKCFIYAPVDVYSGYSAHARSKCKAIIELYKDTWDIQIFPCRWGSLPFGFINDNLEEWGFLKEYLVNTTNLSYQPDVMVWITVPNEAQAVGKWNCLITAGIETTLADASWIEGCERMNLSLISSNFSKETFMQSKYDVKDKNTNQSTGKLEITKPLEVLFEGIDVELFKPKETKSFNLDKIKESFCYLFVSHWTQGDICEDRKNVGLLIKSFFEVFKNRKDTPALILKTSIGGTSYIDRREILKRIDAIKKTVNATSFPTIYVLNGDITDKEINELYNHPKVKAMVSLTKGEGFGRTLLEFSLVNKPIITTNWSGHLDFLKPEFTSLIGGEVKQIHPSAVVPNMLLPESGWFSPNLGDIGFYLKDCFENYSKYLENAKRQGYYSRTNFSYEKMKEKLKEIFDKSIPTFPKAVALKLPTMNKAKTIVLPKLQQVKTQ